jgi:hypothetical protein
VEEKMKKPIPDDYDLTQEDIGWGVVRQKEIDELDYKQFVNKIWLGLIVVGTIISVLVGLTQCTQSSSCILDTLILAGKVALFSGIIMYWPALLFGIIAKWIYEFSANRDDRLQRFQQYKNTLARYKSISDEDIVSDYADFISEYYRPDIIWDVSKLPHPKERIMDALVSLNVKETTSDEKKKAIAVIFINLSQFQEGVGDKDLYPLGIDQMKVMKDHESGKIDTMEMAKIMTGNVEGKKLYEKHNVVVMKEMMETLPDKLLKKTAKILLERARASA